MIDNNDSVNFYIKKKFVIVDESDMNNGVFKTPYKLDINY